MINLNTDEEIKQNLIEELVTNPNAGFRTDILILIDLISLGIQYEEFYKITCSSHLHSTIICKQNYLANVIQNWTDPYYFPGLGRTDRKISLNYCQELDILLDWIGRYRQ